MKILATCLLASVLAGCGDSDPVRDAKFAFNRAHIEQCLRDDSCIGEHVLVDGQDLRIVKGMTIGNSSEAPDTIGIGNLQSVMNYPSSVGKMTFVVE